MGGPSPRAPPFPLTPRRPRGAPPLGVPRCAPPANSAPSRGEGASADWGPDVAGGGGVSTHRAPPPDGPPRPSNFRREPTHHPKNSPGENESGGGDVPWRCCEEARPAPERASSVPGEGGPEAAGGGGEGGRAGEGENARGRGRAAPAPPARRTLPSARLPRPRSPPAPQAAGRPGPGCRSSIPGPARSRGGQESGGGDGSWVSGRARGLLSGSTFAAARARSHTHARRRLGTLAARAASAPTQSPHTPTRADPHTGLLQRVTDTHSLRVSPRHTGTHAYSR